MPYNRFQAHAYECGIPHQWKILTLQKWRRCHGYQINADLIHVLDGFTGRNKWKSRVWNSPSSCMHILYQSLDTDSHSMAVFNSKSIPSSSGPLSFCKNNRVYDIDIILRLLSRSLRFLAGEQMTQIRIKNQMCREFKEIFA
ncbi:hypothetical protein BDR05DRAFT_236089 [Suillus weaverae]|nr:hypothetical protein BDR05DRAFT_236089 [Suillus weaverae]